MFWDAHEDHYHRRSERSGKTTFAEEFLPREADCLDFINADLIARGLSPFAPERAASEAGKIMLRQIHDRASAKKNFAFETTLSGLAYARDIRNWRAAGYHVKLIFLKLPTVETAIDRVAFPRPFCGGDLTPD
jgi:predicted ABC-type ATPase